MNYTFSIIKPDAYKHKNEILAKISLSGFNILKSEDRNITLDEAKEFYSIHKEKPFYDDLIEFMTSGPVILLVISSETDTVNSYRNLIGDTDPKNADPHTIRYQYGTDVSRNSVHGADSLKNAKKEIRFFFPELHYIFDRSAFKKYQEFISESRSMLNESVFDKVKSAFKKGSDFSKDVWNATKRESKETKEAVKILSKILKNKEVSDKEKQFLKYQSIDLIKILPLVAIQGIPIPIPITPLLILAGKKIGIDILPNSHNKTDHSY